MGARTTATRAPSPPGRTRRTAPAPACACLGPSNQALQAKPRVGAHDDPLERQADRVADVVLAGGAAPLVSRAPRGPQRACATCAAEEEATLRRSPTDAAPRADGSAAAAAANAVSTGGRPLPAALRGYFEPRLGSDLSRVRIHDDATAARAAEGIDARAFTLGSHVAFAAGAYAPGVHAGRRLIAHELAHVAQQDDGARPVIRRQGRAGTSRFENDVTTPPRLTDGVWRGSVRRREIAPAAGSQPEQTISDETRTVELDPTACRVRLPRSYRFTVGEGTATGICEEPPRSQAVPAVSAARLREIQTSYLQGINDGLRGWYAVRLDGDGCESTCGGRDIPIDVDAHAATGGAADEAITVVNRGGRADAGTICARDFNPGTTVHEGGHQVLGVGDEYPETDRRVLAAVPAWGRIERVRDTDWSRMGSHHSYGRFALFHERHFAHVPAFLRSVFPGCRARLVELSRPLALDFRLSATGGYAAIGDTHGAFLDLGAELGLPLTRLRDWEVTLGPHGRVLGSASATEWGAFLLGARVGLEHTVTPSAGGFRVGAFGEAGYGWLRPPGEPGRSRDFAGTPYGELGLSVGYRFGGSFAGSLGAEVAGGTTLTGVPGPLRDLPRDEKTVGWFRTGVRAVLEF